MSKKSFLIILFISILFLASIALVASKSLRNQLFVGNTQENLVDTAYTPSTDITATTTFQVLVDISPLVLDTLGEDAFITSPVTIKGQIPGSWYFEGSFPIEIEDSLGNILGQGVAQAKGDWMTNELVPFEAKVTFKKTDAEDGYIVFKKDNPSGDPKNDKEVRLPIAFKLYLQ